MSTCTPLPYVLCLLLWGVLVGTCVAADSSQIFFEQLNMVRQEAGLVPLNWDAGLARAAAGHLDDMVDNTFFSTTGSDGSLPGQRVRMAGFQAAQVEEKLGAMVLSSYLSAHEAAQYILADMLEDELTAGSGDVPCLLSETLSSVGVAFGARIVEMRGGTQNVYVAVVDGANREEEAIALADMYQSEEWTKSGLVVGFAPAGAGWVAIMDGDNEAMRYPVGRGGLFYFPAPGPFFTLAALDYTGQELVHTIVSRGYIGNYQVDFAEEETERDDYGLGVEKDQPLVVVHDEESAVALVLYNGDDELAHYEALVPGVFMFTLPGPFFVFKTFDAEGNVIMEKVISKGYIGNYYVYHGSSTRD